MANNFKLVLAASALAIAAVSSGAKAADIVSESGCYLAGDGRLGGMYDAQNINVDDSDVGNLDSDWGTLFGEGRGLVSCGSFNFQGDFAYYDHSTKDDIDGGKSVLDMDTANRHFGGAMFWRDQNVGMLGLTGSRITQDMVFKDTNYLRAGLVGEYFLNDQFTLGASAHYFHTNDWANKDIKHKGFELATNLKFYATPDLSFKLEGALLNSRLTNEGDREKHNGFSVGLEAEYLFWDQGASVFAGGRYSNRSFTSSIDIEDLQAYVGLKFAFGGNTQSLLTRDRSGPIDNTSIYLEKLPNALNSIGAGIADEFNAPAPAVVID
jgi:hypothetical protein